MKKITRRQIKSREKKAKEKRKNVCNKFNRIMGNKEKECRIKKQEKERCKRRKT